MLRCFGPGEAASFHRDLFSWIYQRHSKLRIMVGVGMCFLRAEHVDPKIDLRETHQKSRVSLHLNKKRNS
jgi:copper homeostasis protein CutC